MSFHHALGEHSLAAGDIERASAAAELVTKTAEASGERTYLALGRALFAAIAIHEGRDGAAHDAAARRLDGRAGGGGPPRAWAGGAGALHALAHSLGEGEADLRASLLESPVARSVLAGSAS